MANLANVPIRHFHQIFGVRRWLASSGPCQRPESVGARKCWLRFSRRLRKVRANTFSCAVVELIYP